jgi:iron complex outermembrane recepter protein
MHEKPAIRPGAARPGQWRDVLLAVAASMPASVFPVSLFAAERATDTIDEIIVTARKIEERVQDIPMSVQVLSGDFLDDANLSRLYELQFNVPGLVVNNVGLFGAGFSLRGIASQGGTGAAVATHMNGVFMGDANLAITRTFDLERIEVLKGPQGTLYGRNATGGSINFITRSPEDIAGAAVEGAYGSFSTLRAQGHVNRPFDNGAIRLAFIASEGDGYIRNSVDERRFSESDFWGLRASARVAPSDVVRIDIMAQRVRDDGASGELWTPRPDFLADPRDIRLATVTLENPYLVIRTDHVSINLDYDLEFATLRSVSGYARNHVRNLDDCAGVPLLQGCVRGARPARHAQWSQEIQLLLHGSGPVDGLIGAYYFDADGAIDFHMSSPGLNPDPINDSYTTTSTTAGAVFGQATLRLAQQWSVTGGLRLSREKERFTTIGTGIQDSPMLLVAEHDSDNVSWRFDLEYAAAADLLFYGGVATGYKSGGFTSSLRNGEPDSFDPEHLTAYELGAKSQWLDRRLTLNAAAFYYDFEDMQVSTVTLIEGQPVVEVDNAARAELYGIDAEGVFQVSDGLAISGGAVWMPKREFVEFRNDQSGDMLSGNKLVRAPEWTATGAITYEHQLRSLGTLSGRVEYNYRSSHFYTKENEPQFAQDGFGLLNVLVKFEAASRKWYVFASGRNLTREDYFNQVFLQSSPGYPDTYEVGAGCRF